MTRLNTGFSLLLLVAAILIFAPTIVFWNLYGFDAVLAHWAWVAYLAALTFVGTVLVFTARAKPGQPNVVTGGSKRRFRLGLAALGLVIAILVLAPNLVFGFMYGFDAILAYWGSVILLVVLTFSGLFLIFTDKRRAEARG